MIIETNDDFEQFRVENNVGEWILHVIPTGNIKHPSVETFCIIFIRNILTKKTYCFSINHPDSRPVITYISFIEYIRSNKLIKWAVDHKALIQFLHISNIFDANLTGWLSKNSILDLEDYTTPSHQLIYRNVNDFEKINLVIPLLKHKDMFDDLADDITKMISKFVIDNSFIKFNDIIINTLGKIEQQGIFVDRELFNQRFGIDVGVNNTVYSQYNVYTSTGRPSNRFQNVNYSALNKEDGTRKCFCSRYGNDGRMVLIDYAAFHPRIISYLTKYDISIDIDIYEYLAKLYFHKQEVDETDIKNAKKLTFRQFFGGVEKEYIHIKYLSNLDGYITEQWDFFQKNGYVETPLFKRKITKDHILEPNPPKVFNYILQALEGEISLPRIKIVLDYLENKKTKAVLYTYDAVLFDFYRNDGYETLKELRNIMSFNQMFPMKTYIGNNYHDLRLMEV